MVLSPTRISKAGKKSSEAGGWIQKSLPGITSILKYTFCINAEHAVWNGIAARVSNDYTNVLRGCGASKKKRKKKDNNPFHSTCALL